MRVESPAGKFVLSFERIEPGDSEVLLVGKMGVWDSTTHVSLPELLKMLVMTLRPKMLIFIVRSLFTGGFRKKQSD